MPRELTPEEILERIKTAKLMGEDEVRLPTDHAMEGLKTLSMALGIVRDLAAIPADPATGRGNPDTYHGIRARAQMIIDDEDDF